MVGKSEVKPVIVESTPQQSLIQRLANEVAPIITKARGLIVRSDQMYKVAGEFLKVVKGLRAEVDAAFDPIIKAAHEAHQTAIKQKRAAESPLIEAEGVIKPKIAVYIREREEARRREQARLRREAEEAAELVAQQARLAEARRLVEQGRVDEAAAVIEQPVIPEPVRRTQVYVPPVVKVEGVSVKKVYGARIDSIVLLARAVGDGRVPQRAIMGNMAFLNNQAREFKGTSDLNYPGVAVVEMDSVAAGRG